MPLTRAQHGPGCFFLCQSLRAVSQHLTTAPQAPRVFVCRQDLISEYLRCRPARWCRRVGEPGLGRLGCDLAGIGGATEGAAGGATGVVGMLSDTLAAPAVAAEKIQPTSGLHSHIQGSWTRRSAAVLAVALRPGTPLAHKPAEFASTLHLYTLYTSYLQPTKFPPFVTRLLSQGSEGKAWCKMPSDTASSITSLHLQLSTGWPV